MSSALASVSALFPWPARPSTAFKVFLRSAIANEPSNPLGAALVKLLEAMGCNFVLSFTLEMGQGCNRQRRSTQQPLKMKPHPLGTILPTTASLAINDACAAEQARLNTSFATRVMTSYERRNVGGEVRYYASETLYATVRNQSARWFEVRADGDYSVTNQFISRRG